MELLSGCRGKRKGFYVSSCKAGFFPPKKETERYIKLPGNIQAVRSYGAFAWKRQFPDRGPQKVCQQRKKGSGNPAEMFFEIPLSGILECPFGIFETKKIFHYKNQKIEEKKYTKWMDYDKIKGSPTRSYQKTGGLSCCKQRRRKKETEPDLY